MKLPAAIFALALLAGCASPDDRAPNDCALLARRAQAELPPGVWSRLLWVQREARPGHVYLVFGLRSGGTAAYDALGGTREIVPRSRAPLDVARALTPFALAGWYEREGPFRAER